MIATVLLVIGITLGSLFLFLIIILLLPFTLSAEFAVSETVQRGRAFLSWIHPRIAVFIYDLGGQTGQLNFLGWKKVFRTMEDAMAEPPVLPRQKGERTEASAPARQTPPPERRTGTGGADTAPTEKSRGPETTEQRPGAAGEGASFKRKDQPSSGVQEATAGRQQLSWWGKAKKTWTIIRDLHLASRLYRWLIRVMRLGFRFVRFDSFRFHAKAGVEDPAELGKIYGWYVSLNNCLFGARKNVDIRFEPLFLQERLEFEGNIGFRTSLARLMFPFAVGLATFPYLKMYLAWRRLKKVYREAAPE